MNKFDEELRRTVARYQNRVRTAMNRHYADVANLVGQVRLNANTGRSLWAANSLFAAEVDRRFRVMGEDVVLKINEGVYAGWNIMERSNDAMVEKYLRGMELKPDFQPTLASQLFTRNPAALEAFMVRSEAGMNLSDRVWNLAQTAKNQLELSLAVGIADGKSAAQLSRDVRTHLQEPAKLFRRVRDQKTGALKLSKPAKAYHPGTGVYRSSYKNAMRLTRTEINMAYHTSDYMRRQTLPFVTGITVVLSSDHDVEDICDALQGDYPVGFYFEGWHPQCMCGTESKLLSENDFFKWLDDGQITNAQRVTDLPSGMSNLLTNNLPKLNSMPNKPYWFKNNFGADGKALDHVGTVDKTANEARNAARRARAAAKRAAPPEPLKDLPPLEPAKPVNPVTFDAAGRPVYDFQPPKTQKELIDRLRKLKSLGMDMSVSMQGVSMEAASGMLNAFEVESHILPLQLKQIGTFMRTTGKMGRAEAYYQGGFERIMFNKAYVNSAKEQVIRSFETQLADLNETRAAMRQALDTRVLPEWQAKEYRKILRSTEELIKGVEQRIANGEKKRYWRIADKQKTVFEHQRANTFHEIGHKRYRQLQAAGRYAYNPVLANTEYGASLSGEYFAEWYCQYRMEGSAGIPKDLLDIFKMTDSHLK